MKYFILIMFISFSANAQTIDWNEDTTSRDHPTASSHDHGNEYNEYNANGQASIDAAHKYDADKLESQYQYQKWIDNTSPAERMPDYSYPVR